MFTHAYVWYEDAKEFAIVSIDDILNFDPKKKKNFYPVKRTAQDGTSEHYRARILMLGESEDDLAERIKHKRVRVNRTRDRSESNDDDVQEVQSPRKKKSEPTQECILQCTEQNIATNQVAEHGLQKSREDEHQPGSCLDEVVAEEEHTLRDLKAELLEKDAEIQQLCKLNMALQEKLLSASNSNDDTRAVSSTSLVETAPSSAHHVPFEPPALPSPDISGDVHCDAPASLQGETSNSKCCEASSSMQDILSSGRICQSPQKPTMESDCHASIFRLI